MKKYYGKILFEREGVVSEVEFNTMEEAAAFVAGFYEAKKLSAIDEDDNLEDYWSDWADFPADIEN